MTKPKEKAPWRGSPRGPHPIDRVLPTHRDKQRMLDKYIMKHINRTIAELRELAKDDALFVLEAIAIGILLRAAEKSETPTISMVLHPNIGKKFYLNSKPYSKKGKPGEEPVTDLLSPEETEEEPPG